MLISYTDISKDALISLAKEWVISNMSDTESNLELDVWTDKAISKIEAGELLIEFGEESQTVTLKTKEELNFQESGVE